MIGAEDVQAKMGSNSQSANGLEDHLRNLIIANPPGPAEARSSNPATGTHTTHAGSASPSQETGADRHEFPDGSTSMGYVGTSHEPPPGQPLKQPRKRPNQAQRRHLSSQLSIPIDPRTQGSATPHQGQNFAHGSTSFNARQMSPNNHSPYVSPGPHSAGFPRHGNTTTQSQNQGDGRRRSQPTDPQYNQSSHLTSPAIAPPSSGRRGGRQHVFDHRRPQFRPDEILRQGDYLAQLCFQVVSNSEIDRADISEKEGFRQRIEGISRRVIARYEQEARPMVTEPFPERSVDLKCFGSLSSGFATKDSDMDLGLLSPLSLIPPEAPGSAIPRLLEKAFLDAGLGARLLTRTRVPIIKLCESPPDKLRQGLLEEREKWEKLCEGGQIEHPHDHDNEKKLLGRNNDVEGTAEDDDLVDGSGPHTPSSTEIYFEVPSGHTTQRLYLAQVPGQLLSAYYDTAKRVLHKAGGRDATVSNHKDFDNIAWEILFRVCEAFINGLADARLKERLQDHIGYRPTGENFISNLPNSRKHSLRGLFAEVEVESLLVAWQNWRFQSLFEKQKLQVDEAISAWRRVQHRRFFGDDPRAYTRGLLEGLARLKQISPLHLLEFVQAKHENPTQLFNRFLLLVNSLGASFHEQFPDQHQSVFIDIYLDAVRPAETQTELRQVVALLPGPPSLADVAFLHKRSYVARELEFGLSKSSFDESAVQDIKTYTKILRGTPEIVPKVDGGYQITIALSIDHSGLLGRMREVPDPPGLATSPQSSDRYRDKLEFPQSGIGVQSDINFSAHLALQNTLLLRCYSHTDPRVRPMILFVKHWAKMRGINSGYRGTLSSYGYVLMVLHYLVNVAQPFVCPNLQQLAPPVPPHLSQEEIENTVNCKGYNIQFWRNEHEIIQLANARQLNHNTESIGSLLRGFFEYYAHSNSQSSGHGRGFDWGRDVLSLRTQGGLLTKQTKGWTGARTILEKQEAPQTMHQPIPAAEDKPSQDTPAKTGQDSTSSPTKTSTAEATVKEVRHRYLFAVEDPFELDHNVARTVTHNGIVSIRDEFRRAWGLIQQAGNATLTQDLLQDTNVLKTTKGVIAQLLEDLHGTAV